MAFASTLSIIFEVSLKASLLKKTYARIGILFVDDFPLGDHLTGYVRKSIEG